MLYLIAGSCGLFHGLIPLRLITIRIRRCAQDHRRIANFPMNGIIPIPMSIRRIPVFNFHPIIRPRFVRPMPYKRLFLKGRVFRLRIPMSSQYRRSITIGMKLHLNCSSLPNRKAIKTYHRVRPSAVRQIFSFGLRALPPSVCRSVNNLTKRRVILRTRSPTNQQIGVSMIILPYTPRRPFGLPRQLTMSRYPRTTLTSTSITMVMLSYPYSNGTKLIQYLRVTPMNVIHATRVVCFLGDPYFRLLLLFVCYLLPTKRVPPSYGVSLQSNRPIPPSLSSKRPAQRHIQPFHAYPTMPPQTNISSTAPPIQ